MTVERLREHLDLLVEDPSVVIWLKRLSANDTQLTGGHQAGPYIPREAIFRMIPELNRPDAENPRELINASIASHSYDAIVTVIWYNNRLWDWDDERRGTRNEVRITGWGGTQSPLLDVEHTGCVTVFAFGGARGDRWCRIWICASDDESEFVQERFGPVEPGDGIMSPPYYAPLRAGICALDPSEVPATWLTEFPSMNDIMARSLAMRPELRDADPDTRLVKRRDCEFQLFQSVESAFWLPTIQVGFKSIADFLKASQTITQRRRSRSGRSLEKHVQMILAEDGFEEGIHYDQQCETELGRTADFIFPSEAMYHDLTFPAEKLRMLALKTSLRERWSQILSEADRVPRKHLLTVDTGLAPSQLQQMREHKITLVVPTSLQHHIAGDSLPKIQSLADFLDEARSSS